MAQHRAAIEAGDTDVLAAAHLAFKPIVERYLRDGTLNVELGDTWHVARYAEPTVRGGKKTYAEYLHNDAWYDDDGPLAMVNVWLILNDSDAPPRNQLVFCACDAADAIPSASEHMLHAGVSTDEVACEAMSWGRVYVFVSGQRKTARRVLLHGAADVPWIDAGEDRRSCELRYTIQAMPERADDAPGAEEEKDDDAGLGGLFDDSSDSEPGSPDLMSAAWVKRMSRDPVLQGIMARGLERTGYDPASLTQFDIASWLEGLDIAQRRYVISDIAEVRAEQAEINRRFAEFHANDQFPAGG